ncbi:MAG: T9SS type A sorting domain-containing protein, partial [Bacteroidia bacterium]
NFTNHGDYIQRNAFLVEELINRVNTNKQGNEQITIIGHSSGAIIARYALAYMEANNLTHNTKLFASIDAPNKGLNVPLSYQFLIKEFGGNSSASVAMSALFGISGNMFNQLVKWNTNGSGFINSPTTQFTSFFNELNTLNGNGFPKLCKNIAVSNGAKNKVYQSNKTGTPELALWWKFWTPGNIIVNTDADKIFINTGNARTFFDPSLLVDPPPPPTTQFIQGHTSAFFLTSTDFAVPLSEIRTINGMDVAPGGFTNFFSKFDDFVRNQIYTLSNETHEYGGTIPNTCFVPTTSALGLSDNWFYEILSDVDVSCKIPFDAYYAPMDKNDNSFSVPTIASNWLFNQIIMVNNTEDITANTNYNFGVNTSDIIFNNVNVKNNANFYINKQDFTDNISKNSYYGNAQTYTKDNSIFTLATSCKKNVNITIENGATLQLGDNLRSGILRINNGSTLILKGNSITTIKNNSKIIIATGGKLIFEEGASINLQNSNSIIEIKDGGKIVIGANATFNYSGNGYLLFEDNYPYKTNIIAGGTNAKFSIDGIDRKKVIEVTGNEALYPDDALALFEIKNAKIVLNENTRIIAGCPVKMSYVDITSNPSFPSLKHRGLHLFGQKADLNLLTVVRGIRGITAYNNVNGNDLNITSFTAIGCEQGLWVNDKGVKIFGGTLTNNSKQGLFLNAQSRPSELWSINASNCLSGADVIGNKGALARFYYPNLQGNGSGIFAENSTITANCGYIKNNNNYNVYLKDNSLLDLDPAHISGVGMIDFSSTGNYAIPYVIKLDKAAHGPYLNNSKSNLVSGNWKIWGDLRDISTLFSFLYSNITVNNNYWSQPTGLKLPIYNSDYKVTYTLRSFPFNNPSVTNLDYEDHFPNSTSPNIGSCNPFNNTTMSITNGLTNKYAADGSNLTEVLKSGVDKLYGASPNITGAVADFKTILQTSFNSTELYNWTVPINYTLDKLYEAVAKGLQDSTYTLLNADNSDAAIFTSTVAIYNTWISNYSENIPVKFSVKLNKALFYRLFNKRSLCLSQLNDMSATVDSMDMNLLEYYKCVVDKEVKMANNEINREDYYVFDACVAMLNIPSDRSIPAVTLEKNKVQINNENNTIVNSLTVFNLFPNPAANQLNLAFNATGKENYTIEIFDILGKRQFFINKTSEMDNYVTINTENLSAGSYFLKMNVDGIYKSEKFVIAK